MCYGRSCNAQKCVRDFLRILHLDWPIKMHRLMTGHVDEMYHPRMFGQHPNRAEAKLICLPEKGVELADSIFDRCAHSRAPILPSGDLQARMSERNGPPVQLIVDCLQKQIACAFQIYCYALIDAQGNG